MFESLEGDLFYPDFTSNISSRLDTELNRFLNSKTSKIGSRLVDYENSEVLLVFIVDGLGDEFFRSPLLKSNFRNGGEIISSTYPSITPTALSSIFSGLSPGMHGITGHQLPWFRNNSFFEIIQYPDFRWLDYDFVNGIDPFLRKGRLQEIREPQYYLWGQFNPFNPSHGIIPMLFGKKIHSYFSFNHLSAQIVKNLKKYNHKRVLIVYSMIYDIYCHLYGKTSFFALSELKKWDLFFSKLVNVVQGKLNMNVRILVTADHGHKLANQVIKLPKKVVDKINNLSHGIGKSGRTLHFYPKEGQEDRIVKQLDTYWGDYGVILQERQIAELLGPGSTSSAVERAGRINFVPFKSYVPRWYVTYGWFNDFLGFFKRIFPTTEHGGLSLEELRTPFISIRT